MDHKTLLRGLNTIRAIEANARIGKVLLHDLEDIVPAFEEEFGHKINLLGLKGATEVLIQTADAIHDFGTRLAKNKLKIPPDDADGVILVVQCCGK